MLGSVRVGRSERSDEPGSTQPTCPPLAHVVQTTALRIDKNNGFFVFCTAAVRICVAHSKLLLGLTEIKYGINVFVLAWVSSEHCWPFLHGLLSIKQFPLRCCPTTRVSQETDFIPGFLPSRF
jgi:hypothetical protein